MADIVQLHLTLAIRSPRLGGFSFVYRTMAGRIHGVRFLQGIIRDLQHFLEKNHMSSGKQTSLRKIVIEIVDLPIENSDFPQVM